MTTVEDIAELTARYEQIKADLAAVSSPREWQIVCSKFIWTVRMHDFALPIQNEIMGWQETARQRVNKLAGA